MSENQFRYGVLIAGICFGLLTGYSVRMLQDQKTISDLQQVAAEHVMKDFGDGAKEMFGAMKPDGDDK